MVEQLERECARLRQECADLSAELSATQGELSSLQRASCEIGAEASRDLPPHEGLSSAELHAQRTRTLEAARLLADACRRIMQPHVDRLFQKPEHALSADE